MARMNVKENYAEESTELDLEEVVDDEEEEDCEELQFPRPTSWIHPKTGKVVQGMEVFSLRYESRVRPNNHHTRRKDDEFDTCPICYHLWTSDGTHQLCCLPCGHMYGLSCIETWLQTCSSRNKKQRRPQCKTLCTLKDVRLLYATRLCIPNATAAADQIVVDQMVSTRCFPYSSAGVNAYRDYELGRILYASDKRFDVLKQRADVLRQQNVAMKHHTKVLNRKAHAEKQAKSLEQQDGAMGRADALRRQADVLGRLADKYLHKADAFGRRADAYDRRAEALHQRLENFDSKMAHSDNNALSSAFKTFFERETLTGPNFNEWYRSLRIVLRKPPAVVIYDMRILYMLQTVPWKNLSLNKDFGDFVRNFNMHCVGKTVSDLHALLIDYEKGLKDKVIPTLKPIPRRERNNPNMDQVVTTAHDTGHWKRICPLYLEELRANSKKSVHCAAGFNDEGKLAYGDLYLLYGQWSTRSCLLESINEESFDKCGILYFWEDERNFYAILERATGLSWSILNDVCGPLRHVSRKVFKAEVEQQLGKQDKALRLIEVVNTFASQEFKELSKAIYGLKQASRQWNKRFDEEIKKFGFIQNRDEPCVYRKASGVMCILNLYVGDILIMGNNIPKLKEVKDYLGKCFSVKDLGEAAYILGIKIYRDRSLRLIGLNQTVGSLMYAVRCTRPVVAFAPNTWSVDIKHESGGSSTGLLIKLYSKVSKGIERYVLWLYGRISRYRTLMLKGFFDASWQSVDWRAESRTTIAMHATQSEYMAASEAAMEAVWIRKFVEDLGVMPSISKPINMYCDNSAAIIFANEPGVMKGARHFLRRYHYVREQVESGEIKLIKVHTDKNLADAFTKALPRGKVNEHANGIGLRLASSFMHICD
ncbi:retrotransposon protein, putative, ty1-copia subclass [Tanacetum coccineum]|uniref:Retrotransposon protein, putative, ty1-copia subclass n=1 Tax=Tanacetum coccineum TaxID=301880 RepID=A0ABQ5I2J1_9ASTR